MNQRLFASIVIGALALVFAASSVSFAQTIMLDGTGSMAQQRQVEAELVASVSEVTPIIASFKMFVFSEGVLGAQAERVMVEVKGGRSRIEHVNQRRMAALRADVRARLQDVLNKPRPARAAVTNLAAVFLRADSEAHPVLVVTDGEDETGSSPSTVGSGEGVLVVLCSAKRDPVRRELETFRFRKSTIARMLPAASIFACFEMQKAVAQWASTASQKEDSVRLARSTAR